MRKVVVAAIFLVGLFLFGCNKNYFEDLDLTNPTAGEDVILDADYLADESPTTKALDELAKIVAYSLQDVEFRRFIKQEAMKQVDGDFDVIYELVKNKGIIGKESLKSYLNRKASELYGKKVDIEGLISKVKDFQISVPVHCEQWDVDNYIPLVTYIPESFDESTFKFVKAYDSEGNVYSLSVEEEPDYPVVVLGSCERMDYIEGKSIDPDYEDGGGNNFPIDPNPPDPNPNPTPPAPNGNYEYLISMKVENVSAVESWLQGKPEFSYLVKPEDFSDYIIKGIPADRIPNRSDINNWNDVNFYIFRWDEDLGSYYFVSWIEHDVGRIISLPIEFKGKIGETEVSVIITINISNNDDLFTNDLVQRNDPQNLIYSVVDRKTHRCSIYFTRKLK